MKKGSQRTLSRILAGVMIMSSLSTNLVYADTTSVNGYDDVLSQSAVTYYAAEPEVGTDYTWNFRDGSIIPAESGGKTDPIESGLISINGSYRWNDPDHGVEFGVGSSIEVKVAGSGTLKVGGCEYSGGNDMTVTSADESFSDTRTLEGKVGCYHNDGSTIDFVYDGPATTLKLTFNQKAYVPEIKFIAEKEGSTATEAEKNVVYTFDFTKDTMTSAGTYGLVAVGANGRFNDSQHGVQFKGIDLTFDVAGNTLIKFGGCQYSGGTFTASSETGDFENVSVDAQTKTCYHQDGVTADILYVGEAGKVTVTVENAYVNTVKLVPVPYDVDLVAWAQKDFSFDLNGNTVSVTGAASATESSSVTVAGGEALVVGTVDASIEANLGGKELSDELISNVTEGYTAKVVDGKIVVTLKDETTKPYEYTIEVSDNSLVANAEAGVTYTYNFKDDSQVPKNSSVKYGKFKTTDGLVTFTDASNKSYWHDTSHGLALLPDCYFDIKVAGDAVITFAICQYGQAGNAGNYVVTDSKGNQIATIPAKSPSEKDGEEVSFSYAGAADTLRVQLVSSVAGEHYLHGITVKNDSVAEVTGKLTAPESIPAGYSLTATDEETGRVYTAEIGSGEYKIALPVGYSYKYEVKNANGYVVGAGADLKVDAEKVTQDVTIIAVELVKVTGKFVGLDADSLARTEMVLQAVPKDAIYVPEVKIENDTYTADVEKGVEYKYVFTGTDDYTFAPATVTCTADAAQDVTFTAKPVYAVTMNIEGENVEAAVIDDIKSTVNYEFTMLDDPSYSYAFANGEDIKLRDGVYTVSAAGYHTHAVKTKPIANLKVSGAATEKTVTFVPVTNWTFNDVKPIIDAEGAFEGIICEGGANGQSSKAHIAAGTGASIKVPVKKGDYVEVTYYYKANFTVDGEAGVSDYSTGSTSKYDSSVFTAKNDGYMVLEATAETYFTGVKILSGAYRETLEVGTDKEFKTIGEALAYAEGMVRPNDERVEILVDPGNYEEMLVVNGKNITIKNSAKRPSIALKNKGVDIADNAVRITSYYGHGYNYYSMTTDCKYDADVLAANKENGYASYDNPGGSSNNGYWNATVTVRGEGFIADNIIFENSFNQYVSEKEANDVLVLRDGNKTGVRPTTAGDTSVQQKKYVERAAAMAILGDQAFFNNCRFVGRQDTLYGAAGCRAYFCKGVAMGAVDFIFGGMIAVFDRTNLQINTSDDLSDISYLTAAQQKSGRGFLMYNCKVTSTTPGVETASEHLAKAHANFLGRPWEGNTSETVFYNTTVGKGWDPNVEEYTGTGIRGDVDKDGVITANDAAAAFQFSLVSTFDEKGIFDKLAADATGDGKIEANDATEILQKTLVSTYQLSGGDTVEGEDPNTKSLLNGAHWSDSLNKSKDADFGTIAPVYDYNTVELGEPDEETPIAQWPNDYVFSGTGEALPDETAIVPENWTGDWDVTDLLPQLEETTVYVVGDSTACDYAPTTDTTYYYKRVGFGTRLGDYLAPEATVVNLALSGRSSSSFTEEANYKTLIDSMQEGDYLIIAFGHNDEKAGDVRYTEPLGDKDTAGSFKNSLYKNYIVPAQEKGVTPILATPIVRRTDSGAWSDNSLHVANGKSYSLCVQELGEELGLTVIDNTTLTKDLYDTLTPSGTVDLHAWLSYKSSSVDNTHLNNYGAAYVAYLMADAIANSDSTLADYVNDDIAAPDKETNLIVNPDYEMPNTADPDSSELEASVFRQLGKATAPWFGTIFGDCGGITKYINCDSDGNLIEPRTLYEVNGVPNVDITEGENSVTIRYGNAEKSPIGGKIAGTTDTFLLYAMEQDAASNFELSATATVNAMTEDPTVSGYGQISFGAICLDRLVVDANTKETYDYVAAGAVKYSTSSTDANTGETTTSKAYLTFTRNTEDSSLSTNVKEVYNPKVGDVIPVSIKKVGNKFTVTYGDYTTTYEKEMEGSVYYGFYVTRLGEVTFSNISYNNELVE